MLLEYAVARVVVYHVSACLLSCDQEFSRLVFRKKNLLVLKTDLKHSIHSSYQLEGV